MNQFIIPMNRHNCKNFFQKPEKGLPHDATAQILNVSPAVGYSLSRGVPCPSFHHAMPHMASTNTHRSQSWSRGTAVTKIAVGPSAPPMMPTLADSLTEKFSSHTRSLVTLRKISITALSSARNCSILPSLPENFADSLLIVHFFIMRHFSLFCCLQP